MKLQTVAKPAHKRRLDDDMVERAKQETVLELKQLKKNYSEAIERLSLVDRLVETADRLLTPLYPVKYPPRAKPSKGKITTESAGLQLSDAHVGQVVNPNQTLGFGRYNFKVFSERLVFIEDRVRSIMAHHVSSRIDDLVVFLLGDIAHGALGHGSETVRAMSLFDQFYSAAHCFAQFLMNLAQDVEQVRVYTAVGNHGRWANQKKMPTEQRYSNLDHFIYAMVKSLVSRQPNIVFTLDKQPFAYVDMKGTKILAMHGDHLKGGDKQMGVPIHAISRQISGITGLYESRGLEAPHYWLMGDKHKNISLPTVKGEFLVNGAFVGDDNYSLTLSTSSEPMQRFFGIHPKYRMTWEYRLKLKHAPSLAACPYQLPAEVADTVL